MDRALDNDSASPSGARPATGPSVDGTEGDAERAQRGRLDEVLGLMTHDLKNPIGAIAGSAQLLRMLDLDEAAREEQLELIEGSAKRVLRKLDDIQDVSRFESGRFTLEVEEVDPAEIARAVVDAHQASARKRGVTLSAEVPEARTVFPGDAGRVRQVVDNLVENALTFTEEGGSVRVMVTSDADRVTLRVRDDGRGIEPDLVPRLLEPYFMPRSGDTRGPGLGLALARAVMGAHRGSLRLLCAPGQGTDAVCAFPRRPTAARPTTDEPPRSD